MDEKWVKLASCWDTDQAKYSQSYEVSNYGIVRSVNRACANGGFYKSKVIKTHRSPGSYETICVRNNGFRKTLKVHSCVYYSFHGGCPNGHEMVIDHIDNDKTNNKLDNLQLITQSDNCIKAKSLVKTRSGQLYIHVDGKSYRIQRTLNKKNISFGSFTTLEEAISRRDELIKNNWNV